MSLEEQVSRKCIHFNGIMNKCCEAGINYDSVRIDRPFKFPCLKQGGECASAVFPTEEQVKKELEEMEARTTQTISAMILIQDHIQKTKDQSGTIKCVCGGKLSYAVAGSNGHIRANCKDCGISFME